MNVWRFLGHFIKLYIFPRKALKLNKHIQLFKKFKNYSINFHTILPLTTKKKKIDIFFRTYEVIKSLNASKERFLSERVLKNNEIYGPLY